ncbi:uncharacterized protein LOC114460823 [Gouania willdenowi]|uniref:uncharacterized protein LOC114460823 n=1 Tax=Gouania willdenowi TaxID=441366 RepID=UPI001054A49B|nr:uncharacterized protein LOC114460823 [Gouania willdenowi]
MAGIETHNTITFRRNLVDYAVLIINGDLVEKVWSFRFLGVHIQEELSWATIRPILSDPSHPSSLTPPTLLPSEETQIKAGPEVDVKAAPSPAVTALLPHSTQTVSPAEQSTSAPSTDPSPHSSSCHDWVGPDNIEGYGAVQDLADYLAGLRDHRLALTQEECSQVIALWQELGEYDKKKTVYPARHQTSLSKGRFRATKKIVAPGVESTKRSFIGAHSPAQWPDCNRVVEVIFVKLFAIYPSTVRCEGKKLSRYTVVIRAYNNIRECVVTNARLMSETTIQLPEVNAATVSQW